MLSFGSMPPLPAERVCYIVVHTAGTPAGEDTSVESIHRYHRSKGWAGVGYHFVVRKSGAVEVGRPVDKQGAHVAGINNCSLGVAFSGNGDLHPPTPAQMESALKLLARLVQEYKVEIRNVIGHREVNQLIEQGKVPTRYRTPKSCPGVRVSMHRIRKQLADLLHPPPPPVTVPPPIT